MNIITIDDATPAYDGTVLKSRHVLALKGTYYRFGIGGIPRGQSGRKVTAGPLVPGPWAYAFGLSSVIAANPEMSTGAEMRRNAAEGIEHTVTEGDHVTFDGVTYEVRVVRRQYIELVPVETPAPRQTQNFLHGEALDPAQEAYWDECAAEAAADSARPDFDTRDREGSSEPPRPIFRDCCACEVGIVTEGCRCECHGDGGETGPRRRRRKGAK